MRAVHAQRPRTTRFSPGAPSLSAHAADRRRRRRRRAGRSHRVLTRVPAGALAETCKQWKDKRILATNIHSTDHLFLPAVCFSGAHGVLARRAAQPPASAAAGRLSDRRGLRSGGASRRVGDLIATVVCEEGLLEQGAR